MPTSRNVRFTSDAALDFDEIADYTLDRWGPLQVHEYLAQLQSAIDHLSMFPELGLRRFEFGPGMYCFPTHERMIFYQFDRRELVVYRILHNHRLPTIDDFA